MSSRKAALVLMRAVERARRQNRHQHNLRDGKTLQDQLCDPITTTDCKVLSRMVEEYHSHVATIPRTNNGAAHLQMVFPGKPRTRRNARVCTEAGSDPRGHLWVTLGVHLWAGKPPVADIILSHPPDLT